MRARLQIQALATAVAFLALVACTPQSRQDLWGGFPAPIVLKDQPLLGEAIPADTLMDREYRFSQSGAGSAEHELRVQWEPPRLGYLQQRLALDFTPNSLELVAQEREELWLGGYREGGKAVLRRYHVALGQKECTITLREEIPLPPAITAVTAIEAMADGTLLLLDGQRGLLARLGADREITPVIAPELAAHLQGRLDIVPWVNEAFPGRLTLSFAPPSACGSDPVEDRLYLDPDQAKPGFYRMSE